MTKNNQKRKKMIGILNKGKNNQFIDNKFVNLDIGIQDEGEKTTASGNVFSRYEKIKTDKKWFSMNNPIVYFIVAIFLGIITKLLNIW